MKLIVCSKNNAASNNVFHRFTEKYGFNESKLKTAYNDSPVYTSSDYDGFYLIHMNNTILDLEFLNEHFNPDTYIIASTHTSKSGGKTLTCHPTGNFSLAQLGGKKNEVCLSPAQLLRNCYFYFKKHNSECPEYEVCLEATHHGPSEMNAPLMFAECGGSEKE